MNTIIYITIFIIGTLFGSFFTLATYRIPIKQDITHTHSYCPNCNSKLGFFELIPVLSYIFLRGKCKHCGKKISPRYIIFEIISGLTFLLFALSLNINIQTSINLYIYFIFVILYLTFIFLIAGIDKENIKIDKSVLIFGGVISVLYIVYLYIIEKISIYRYIIYLAIYVLLTIVQFIITKKKKKENYTIGILTLLTIMTIFTAEYVTINTIIVTLSAIAIYLLIYKIKNKFAKTNLTEKFPIGYFLSISNIIVFLIITFLVS